MASNQNVNKVVYGNTTLIDLTGDDVTAASVLSGKKFHLKSGAAATGTIATKTASNLSANGKTVTVPAGYYASQATKDVATGSATAPASISGSSATVSTGTNTLTLTKTISVTPSVTAGYVASGTAGNSSVSLTASVNTRSSSDLTKSGLTITAPAGYYASAASASASDSNLVAGNIKSGVSIFGVTGSYSGSTVSTITTQVPSAIVQGSISSSGKNTDSTTRVRSGWETFPNGSKFLRVKVPSGFKLKVYVYTSRSTSAFSAVYPSDSTYSSNTPCTVNLQDGYCYRYLILKSDESTITPNDILESDIDVCYI